MSITNTFSVIIPTRNRKMPLKNLIESLLQQSVLPKNIVIIDSSDIFDDSLEYLSSLVVHIHTSKKSTAKQRNLGLLNVHKNTSAIFFLDDDTRPEINYFEKMLKTLWSSGAIGVSGLALNPNKIQRNKPYGLQGLVRKLFLLDSNADGSVLKSGIGIPVREINNGWKKVEWLIGCSCWDFQRIKHIQFEEDFEGYSLGEDLIFSVRASKFGLLIVDSSIVLPHIEMMQNETNLIQKNFMWVYYRFRVSRYVESKFQFYSGFYWSIVGRLLISICCIFLQPKKSVHQIFGIVIGLQHLLKTSLKS